MLSLDHQDGPSYGQVGLVGDRGRSAKVGGHSDTLEDLGSIAERFDAVYTKVVGALLDGSRSGSFQSGREEVDMDGLFVCDLGESLSNVGSTKKW